MLGGLVGHDSCCCSSVSEPSLMALLWRVLMCGGGWFGLSSSFLGRQYATLGPEALCWEGLLGTIPAAVRVFRNRSSQLFSAMG